jgi:hypothetical protein
VGKKRSVFVSRIPTICLNCAKSEKKYSTGHWRDRVGFKNLRDAENGLRSYLVFCATETDRPNTFLTSVAIPTSCRTATCVQSLYNLYVLPSWAPCLPLGVLLPIFLVRYYWTSPYALPNSIICI